MPTDVHDDAEKGENKTLLTIPMPLYRRILGQAKLDRRTVRPQVLVLLEEALEARERRK